MCLTNINYVRNKMKLIKEARLLRQFWIYFIFMSALAKKLKTKEYEKLKQKKSRLSRKKKFPYCSSVSPGIYYHTLRKHWACMWNQSIKSWIYGDGDPLFSSWKKDSIPQVPIFRLYESMILRVTEEQTFSSTIHILSLPTN